MTEETKKPEHTMIKAFRYRMFPTEQQEKVLLNWCASAREIYNAALDQRKWYGRAKGTDLHGRDSMFTAFRQGYEVRYRDLKQDESLVWLTDAPSSMVSFALDDLHKAFQAFFKGNARFPKYRKPIENESFTIQCKTGKNLTVIFGKDSVKLPKWKKIGPIKYNKHKNHKGMTKNATVICEGGKWFISVICEIPINEIRPNSKPEVGINLGVDKPVVLSNEEIWEPDEGLLKLNKRTRRLQRELSRCQKDSKRRQRKRQQLANSYVHVSSRRKARNHAITTNITRRFGTIYIEDTKVKELTKSIKWRENRKSSKKTKQEIQEKSSTNREILNVAPYQFRAFLEYKAKNVGGKIVPVKLKDTSDIEYRRGGDIHVARMILSSGLLGAGASPHKTPSETNSTSNNTFGTATSNLIVSPCRVEAITSTVHRASNHENVPLEEVVNQRGI